MGAGSYGHSCRHAAHAADLRGHIPTFIHISDGQPHEVNVLDMLAFEAGAFYGMDRG